MSSLRVLMCSHDRWGLGSTSRTIAIASRLALDVPACSILVLTDLAIVGRFRFPQNVDFVRLPGVPSHGNGFGPVGKGDPVTDSVLRIRRKITQSVAKSFRPDIVVVERDPIDLPDEMRKALGFVRQELPGTRIVWGLPDVVGEPQAVVASWKRAGVLDLFDGFCDEIWIHGDRGLFDSTEHYAFPSSVAEKTLFTGYLRPSSHPSDRVQHELAQEPKRPLVILTPGGGANGYPLIDSYFRFLESMKGRVPIRSVVISGPMMGSDERDDLARRAQRLPHLICHRFSKHLLEYLRQARLVVFSGGYNTHCANLAFRKRSIVWPTPSSANEHAHRGRVFAELGVLDLLGASDLEPERLGRMVMTLANGAGFPEGEASCRIPMEGLDHIGERIRALAGAPALSARGHRTRHLSWADRRSARS